jgi:hypothetical protein
MPITNMDSANSAGITSYTLTIGVDLPLYTTTAGYINAGNLTGAVFGIPPQSSVWRGMLWLQAVPNAAPGGTGAISLAVLVSLDGGTTFQAIGAAQAAWTAGAGSLVKVDVSGLGGNGQFKVLASGLTLGTATGFNIWAHLG